MCVFRELQRRSGQRDFMRSLLQAGPPITSEKNVLGVIQVSSLQLPKDGDCNNFSEQPLPLFGSPQSEHIFPLYVHSLLTYICC